MKNELEKSKAEFAENCESSKFDKQNRLVKACVERAIEEYIKNELSIRYPDYQIKCLKSICSHVSYEITYYVITNRTMTTEKIAQSLNKNFDKFHAVDENFSLEVFTKIAEKVFQFLAESLPENSGITLPEYLWDMEEYNSVRPDFDFAEDMRICIEYYKFDTIIEGKNCSVKELKKMFKQAIKLRNNNYNEFAELFCQLFDFRIIKVIPPIGMVCEHFSYILDIDTDIILANEGGWHKFV